MLVTLWDVFLVLGTPVVGVLCARHPVGGTPVGSVLCARHPVGGMLFTGFWPAGTFNVSCGQDWTHLSSFPDDLKCRKAPWPNQPMAETFSMQAVPSHSDP